MDDIRQAYTQLEKEYEAVCRRLAELEAVAAAQQQTLEELHVAEEELAATRQVVEVERTRYAALFDLAPDGYLVTDAAGTIREANRAAAALLALPPDELLGKPLLVYVAEDDRRAFRTQLARLPQVQRVQDWVLRLQPRHQPPFPVGITVAISQPPQTRHPLLYWLLRDLTEQQRLAAQLRRTEHLALLGQLAASVSHDIRNPLGAIFLQVDVLAEELAQPSADSPAAMTDALTDIKAQLARLDDLVQDYLALARVGSLERTPQDVSAVVAAWSAEFQEWTAAHGVQLQVDGLETLGQVACHASTLRRALFNLVQNGSQAATVRKPTVVSYPLYDKCLRRCCLWLSRK